MSVLSMVSGIGMGLNGEVPEEEGKFLSLSLLMCKMDMNIEPNDAWGSNSTYRGGS